MVSSQVPQCGGEWSENVEILIVPV